jgi:hypothetical protein
MSTRSMYTQHSPLSHLLWNLTALATQVSTPKTTPRVPVQCHSVHNTTNKTHVKQIQSTAGPLWTESDPLHDTAAPAPLALPAPAVSPYTSSAVSTWPVRKLGGVKAVLLLHALPPAVGVAGSAGCCGCCS